MYVELDVLKKIIEVSEQTVYVHRDTHTAIFVSKDHSQMYLIQNKPDQEETFENLSGLRAIDKRELLRAARALDEKELAPDLWKIVDACTLMDVPSGLSHVRRFSTVIETLSKNFATKSESPVMAYLPPLAFMTVFWTVQRVYGSYSDAEAVVFRFPTVDDEHKMFTFRAKMDGGYLSAISTSGERGMVTWR